MTEALRHSALLTDLYELTMAAAYFENGFRDTASFELFVRSLPPQRGYLLWTLHPARLSPNAPNSVKKKSLIPEANKSSARPTLMAALAKASSHERPNTIQRPSCCSAALCAKASLTPSPNLEQIRDHARHELSRLPELCRRLQNPEPYPVHFSRELGALLEDLRHGLIQPAGKKGA